MTRYDLTRRKISYWASAMAKAERTWTNVLVMMSSLVGFRAALVTALPYYWGIGGSLADISSLRVFA